MFYLLSLLYCVYSDLYYKVTVVLKTEIFAVFLIIGRNHLTFT